VFEKIDPEADKVAAKRGADEDEEESKKQKIDETNISRENCK
jgi:hypothetical protein